MIKKRVHSLVYCDRCQAMRKCMKRQPGVFECIECGLVQVEHNDGKIRPLKMQQQKLTRYIAKQRIAMIKYQTA